MKKMSAIVLCALMLVFIVGCKKDAGSGDGGGEEATTKDAG